MKLGGGNRPKGWPYSCRVPTEHTGVLCFQCGSALNAWAKTNEYLPDMSSECSYVVSMVLSTFLTATHTLLGG